MLKITEKHNRWIISKNGRVLFVEIKTPQEALAIAKANGLILSDNLLNTTKRAA